MKDSEIIQKFISKFHLFRDGIIDKWRAAREALQLFRLKQPDISEVFFHQLFPVLAAYFPDPVKRASDFIEKDGIPKVKLLEFHNFMRNSSFLRSVFLSSYYPWSMLMRAAQNLLSFAKTNPSYLPSIQNGELTGPMMLEIHPTDAICNYRCQMCIWCGGRDKKLSLKKFYTGKSLLLSEKWLDILRKARALGTQQIILSGGGEPLLAKEKFGCVLEEANALGFNTMIYTNGRMLGEIDSTILGSILESTWLRISLHATTPEKYAKLVSKPENGNNLQEVLRGIERVISQRDTHGANLKIGVGVVLQAINHNEVQEFNKLASLLGIDFLDLRADCIGAAQKLNSDQRRKMLGDLRHLRDDSEAGRLNFDISIADTLIADMDGWNELELTSPKRCFIPLIRPAVDPYGIMGACDSIGEPYTRSQSPPEYVLGEIGDDMDFVDMMQKSCQKRLDIRCQFCMPGQISLNALLEKLVDDTKFGIDASRQYFNFIAA